MRFANVTRTGYNHAPMSRTSAGSPSTAVLPAALLVVVQLLGGMREMPLFTFFGIYLQESLNLSAATFSSIVAASQLVGTLTALLGGVLTARIGGKWILAAGLLLSALSTFVLESRTTWVLVLLWLAGGAGGALVTVGGSSYLTRLGGRGALGFLAALYALSVTAGGAIGSPIAGVLINTQGFAAFGRVALLMSAVALACALLMPDLRAPPPAAGAAPSFASIALPALRRRGTQMLMVLRGLPTILYGMMTVLIPLLINQLAGDKVLVASYGTATLVFASVAQLLAGRAADRWGARMPSLVAFAALAVAGLGLGFGAGTVTGLFVFGVLGIAAAWALATLSFVWVSDGIPQPEHPAVFGLLHAVWSLCMIGGSLLGGWLVRLSPGLPLLLGGLLNVGSLLLVAAYYRRIAVGGAR